jgi:hypothetical protein
MLTVLLMCAVVALVGCKTSPAQLNASMDKLYGDTQKADDSAGKTAALANQSAGEAKTIDAKTPATSPIKPLTTAHVKTAGDTATAAAGTKAQTAALVPETQKAKGEAAAVGKQVKAGGPSKLWLWILGLGAVAILGFALYAYIGMASPILAKIVLFGGGSGWFFLFWEIYRSQILHMLIFAAIGIVAWIVVEIILNYKTNLETTVGIVWTWFVGLFGKAWTWLTGAGAKAETEVAAEADKLMGKTPAATTTPTQTPTPSAGA